MRRDIRQFLKAAAANPPIQSDMDTGAPIYAEPYMEPAPKSSLLDNQYLTYGAGGALGGAALGALINKLRGGSALKGGLIGGGIGAGLGLGGAALHRGLKGRAAIKELERLLKREEIINRIRTHGRAPGLGLNDVDLRNAPDEVLKNLDGTLTQHDFNKQRAGERAGGMPADAYQQLDNKDQSGGYKPVDNEDPNKKASARVAHEIQQYAKVAFARANEAGIRLYNIASSNSVKQASKMLPFESEGANEALYAAGGGLLGAGGGALLSKLLGYSPLKGGLIGGGLGAGAGYLGGSMLYDKMLADALAAEQLANDRNVSGTADNVMSGDPIAIQRLLDKTEAEYAPVRRTADARILAAEEENKRKEKAQRSNNG
jgi:hypothetical protein